MKNIVLSIFIILMSSCKFTTSPYNNEIAKSVYNKQNIRAIKVREASAPSIFKIALISDTHNYYDDLNTLIKKINNDTYAFVIVAGDLVNNGLVEEFEQTVKLLNKLHYPYVVVVGNHDSLINGRNIFNRTFGPDNFSFEYKNLKFILFDNNNWECDGYCPDSYWVQSELESSTKPYNILVSHVPFDDPDRFTESEIQIFKDLAASYSIPLMINGHNHNPGVVEVDFNTTQITVGAPSKRVFFELRVSPQGIQYQKLSF